MNPFKIECPECGATLKISDPTHIGKKAKCPKCRGYMTVPEPPDEEPPAPTLVRTASKKPARKPVQDDFLSDYEQDDFDDLPDEPPPPKPSPKKKAVNKKSKKKSSGDGALARAGGVAVTVFVVLLIGLKYARPFLKLGNAFGWFEPAASGIGPDLAWLPHGSDMVAEIRVSDVVKSPAVAQALQSPQAIAGTAMMTGMLGFNLHDVESLRFAMYAGATPINPNPRFGGVVRLSKAVPNIPNLLEASTTETPPKATKTAHGSRSIYSIPLFPELGMCCVDDQTIIFGSMNELKSVIDRNGTAESTSRFAFLDKPRHVAMVIAPADPKTASGYIGSGSMDMFKKTPMSGVSICGDLDSSVHGAMLINAISKRDAQNAMKEFERDWQRIIGSLAMMGPAGVQLRQALSSAKPTVSGRLVSVTADIPPDVVVNALELGDSAVPAPGMPSGFNPATFNPPTPSPVSPRRPTNTGFAPSIPRPGRANPTTNPFPAPELSTPEPSNTTTGFGSPSKPAAAENAPTEDSPSGSSPFKPKSASPFRTKSSTP